MLRQRYSFTRSTDGDGGEVLHVETWIDPGGGVTPHVHPAMEERFHVLEGRPSFLAGKRGGRPAPGEVVVVPPGVRHAYRNRATRSPTCAATCGRRRRCRRSSRRSPRSSRPGTFTRRGLPTRPRALVQAAALAERHRDMVTLLFPPMPPRAVQRLLFPPLARLAARS